MDNKDGGGAVDYSGMGGGSKADAAAVAEAVVAAEAAAAAAGRKPELCSETSAIY